MNPLREGYNHIRLVVRVRDGYGWGREGQWKSKGQIEKPNYKGAAMVVAMDGEGVSW